MILTIKRDKKGHDQSIVTKCGLKMSQQTYAPRGSRTHIPGTGILCAIHYTSGAFINILSQTNLKCKSYAKIKKTLYFWLLYT